jgi:uncharacterized protein (UPF0276 family)
VADADDAGAVLLIDSHSCEVADPVWALYDRVIARGGPRPTLIEWDADVPDWSVLACEAAHALLQWAQPGDVVVLPVHTAAVRERLLGVLAP